MFSKKKEPVKKTKRTAADLEQFGIFQVPESLDDLTGNLDDISDNDEDFEAELAALSAGNSKPKRPPRRPPVTQANIDVLVKESMKDIHSDEELSGDDDDPDLLDELHEIAGSEPQNESEIESAKVPDEPVVPSRPAPPVPPRKVEEQTEEKSPEAPAIDQSTLNLLQTRQKEYRVAAVAWKKIGETEKALQHVKMAKQFDLVIKAFTEGGAIDLSDMPPAPELPTTSSAATEGSSAPPERVENEMQQDATSVEPGPSTETQKLSLADELKQRLEIYKNMKTAAETEGNSSKARRYVRICKQFEDALKLHARGKPVPLDELPTPPGLESLAPKPPENPPEAPQTQQPPAQAEEPQSEQPQEQPKQPEEESPKADKPPAVPPRRNTGPKQNQQSRAEKQTEQLQQRQQELKLAALKAKKAGDLELAKNYLRQAKGLDHLIGASMSGLPVDMTSIPLSPSAKTKLELDKLKLDDDFTIVKSEDCEEESGTDQQIYENLEAQLVKQIKRCLTTRDHSKELGDVPGYNRWERMAVGFTRDLDFVRVRKRDSLPPPQHHYEVKTFSIVQSCTDLTDNDIEISIIRGVNYARDSNTYVTYEFPFPSENSPTDKTGIMKENSNPEYNAVFTLPIDRSSRQCQRAFKRHAVKFQVWVKGGLFRNDVLLGTANVKLQPLESQCILHDSFPLLDGRKATGGKLEVKLRLRNPIVQKQIETNTDRWLSIDH